jgi:hypothetical protein
MPHPSYDPAYVGLVDQEKASIRDWLDAQGMLGEVLREWSPWAHGAHIAVADCLNYRADKTKMTARLIAWDELLGGIR